MMMTNELSCGEFVLWGALSSQSGYGSYSMLQGFSSATGLASAYNLGKAESKAACNLIHYVPYSIRTRLQNLVRRMCVCVACL